MSYVDNLHIYADREQCMIREMERVKEETEGLTG
jgi:hypothetical protein